MQMLPEIHRNSRTGCNYDSLGLFARFFQDGNGLPEHWNTNPLVEAEKKTLIKWKVWNIPLFWAQMFCTKIQVPFRMKTPCGLFCFSFFRFRSNFAKGYINQYVCSLGINQRQLGDESASWLLSRIKEEISKKACFKHRTSLVRATQWLFSVKYLFAEADDA